MPDGNARESPHRTRLAEGLASDLRRSLGEVLSRAGMGAFLWDLESGLVHVEPGGLAVLGLRPDEFNGRMSGLETCMITDETPGISTLTAGVLAGRDTYGAYFRVRRPDSAVRWAHLQASVQRDAEGAARRVAGIIRDADPELEQMSQQAVLGAEHGKQGDLVQTVTAALSRALTITDVTNALTSEEVLGSLGARAMGFAVVEHDRLRRYGEKGLPPDFLRVRPFYRLDENLPAPIVVRTQIPMFLSREELKRDYPFIWKYVFQDDITFIAFLPLVAQAQSVGAMAILYQNRDRFEPDERNLVLALASAVAQSVKRAMLYDQEHAMALGLQQSMLPARAPDVPGSRIAVRYRPARVGHHIGGDWYDVVPLPTGHLGLVIGDVEGHDVHASAVMGQLRTALRAYAAEGHEPGAVLARASAFLHDLDTDRFATCLYADFDPSTGDTRFIRAGHHGPIVRHGDGSTSRPRIRGGLPLGLSQYGTSAYPVTRLALRPSDSLLMCTDGLLEIHDMDLETGMRRLQAILSSGPEEPGVLADHIVDTLDAGTPRRDDVALLLLTRTPADPGPAER